MKLNIRGAVSTEYNKNKIRYLELTGMEWGRGVSPALFQKLEKSALICGKSALIVVIYG